jgi:uncharacterized protein (DUF2147 family)
MAHENNPEPCLLTHRYFGRSHNQAFNKLSTKEKSMKSRTIAAFVIALIICAHASIAAAQTKPNFSGEWKMNKEKSKFVEGGPDAVTIKMDQKGTALTEDWSLTTPDGESSFQAKYTIDGEVTEQEVLGRTAKTSAKWDGDALVIEFKAGEGFFKRKITMSADGKTITVVLTQSPSESNKEEIVVFEKQ